MNYNEIIKILEQFGFTIRIDDEHIIKRTYVKGEKDRYTNVHFTWGFGTSPTRDGVEVHTNYHQLCSTKDFDHIEKEFENIHIDRTYDNEAHTIHLDCYNMEIFQRYLHRIYPKESREIKLKRLLND